MLFRKKREKKNFNKLLKEKGDIYEELVKSDDSNKDDVIEAVKELTEALGCPMPKENENLYRSEITSAVPLRMLLAGLITADGGLIDMSGKMTQIEITIVEMKEEAEMKADTKGKVC